MPPKEPKKRKALWEIPAKRGKKGEGTAFYPLEDTQSGKKTSTLRGVVVDNEGRVYGERTLARKMVPLKKGGISSVVSMQKKNMAVETDFQLFRRDDGSLALVECFRLVEIPEGVKQVESVRMEPVPQTAQVFPIVPLPVQVPPGSVYVGQQPSL